MGVRTVIVTAKQLLSGALGKASTWFTTKIGPRMAKLVPRLTTLMKGSKAFKGFVKWFVQPITKFGKAAAMRVAISLFKTGKRIETLAIRYPQYARVFNPIAKLLTNKAAVKMMGNIVVFLGFDLSITGATALINRIASGEFSKDELSSMLDGDIETEEEYQTILQMADMASKSLVYTRAFSTDGRHSCPRNLVSSDFRRTHDEVGSALADVVFLGDSSALQATMSRMSTVGLLQFAGRIATLASTTVASIVNDRVRALAKIRSYFVQFTPEVMHDGVNKLTAALAIADDPMIDDGIAMVESLIDCSTDGIPVKLIEMLDKEHNSAWDNIAGFFTTDGAEAESYRRQFCQDENKPLAYAFLILGSVVKFSGTVVADLCSNADEELRFAAEAIAAMGADLAGGDVEGHVELDVKAKLAATAAVEGDGGMLIDAYFDA